ncbi:MAG: head maturation protease, ClpP-related [Actinoallomurus sp.]
MKHIDAALMSRVTALLDSRQKLPRAAKPDGRPRLQVTVEPDVTDLLIYDEIGWFGVSAQDVAASLADVKGDLNVRLNSPGGDVFDGVAIYNMLADHDGQVTVTVDGLAASAASFIAMAGDRIVMNRASQLMIHDASGLCIGNAADMSAMAAMLDTISNIIAGIYADRTGTSAADWRTQMSAETWYDAAEAVQAGLATEMAAPRQRDAEAIAASFDLTVFQFAGRSAAPPPPAAPAADNHEPDIDAISSALAALRGVRQ